MGLLDYIRANTPRATTPRVSPAKVFNEGLLNPNAYNKPAADRFKDSMFGLLGVVPGVGDAASAAESADLFNRGENFSGSMSALGALPFVPSLGGIIKKADVGYLGTKGKDVLDRDIPEWANAKVVHSTSKDAANSIKAEGYKLGSGYYGDAVSFTPDWKYSSQFGDVSTVAQVDPKAKILNLNDPKDWEIWQTITKNVRGDDYRSAVRKAGYDGIYDVGAGDLFIYRPSAVKYIDDLEK